MTQWGDGSGTGTGGTIHVLSQARPIQAGLMWMGMWGSGGPATSNRRESDPGPEIPPRNSRFSLMVP